MSITRLLQLTGARGLGQAARFLAFTAVLVPLQVSFAQSGSREGSAHPERPSPPPSREQSDAGIDGIGSPPPGVTPPESGPFNGRIDLGKGVSLQLVKISPGTFLMGSVDTEGDRDEHPQRKVELTREFWMGRTEVTQAQWEAVMGSNPSRFAGNSRRPVEQVTWQDAREFCRRLSDRSGIVVRLPTEAEWEFACRAGSTSPYSFGQDAGKLGGYGWFRDNSGGMTKAVASKKPNSLGLFDMHGNVQEWCEDWHHSYPEEPSIDPPAAPPPLLSQNGSPVLRGGGWEDPAATCRSANRITASRRQSRERGPNTAMHGFRVVAQP